MVFTETVFSKGSEEEKGGRGCGWRLGVAVRSLERKSTAETIILTQTEKKGKKCTTSVHIFGLIVDRRHVFCESIINDIETTEINCQVTASDIELLGHRQQPRSMRVFDAPICKTNSFRTPSSSVKKYNLHY